MNEKIIENFERLLNSEEYKKIKEKNPDGYFFLIFVVLNSNLEIETLEIDFFVSSEEVFIFKLNEKISYRVDRLSEGKKPNAIKIENVGIEIEELKKIIKEELKNKGLADLELSKVIVTLSKKEKEVWDINCMLSQGFFLSVEVDAREGKIFKSEKKNLFDFMRVK